MFLLTESVEPLPRLPLLALRITPGHQAFTGVALAIGMAWEAMVVMEAMEEWEDTVWEWEACTEVACMVICKTVKEDSFRKCRCSSTNSAK